MKALLVIDMQQGSFTEATPRCDTEGVVGRINKIAERFRINGDKVFFIQHDGTKENAFLPGTHDWKILPSLIIMPEDIIVTKTANDAFYRSELQNILEQYEITEIIITGCATDFCVDTTIRSALGKDYSVIVVKDAHTTANRPNLSAESVIAHHNWVWENMLPTNGMLKVIAFSEL